MRKLTTVLPALMLSLMASFSILPIGVSAHSAHESPGTSAYGASQMGSLALPTSTPQTVVGPIFVQGDGANEVINFTGDAFFPQSQYGSDPEVTCTILFNGQVVGTSVLEPGPDYPEFEVHTFQFALTKFVQTTRFSAGQITGACANTSTSTSTPPTYAPVISNAELTVVEVPDLQSRPRPRADH